MFDLRANSFYLFSIGRTPVHVHVSFLFLIALSFFQNEYNLMLTATWIGAIAVSLLVHEFGHVFANSTNGFRSEVVLWMMGGMTYADGKTRGWRDIWVSLAGPLAGFLLWGICWFALMPSVAAESGMKFDVRSMFSPGWFPGFDPKYWWHHLWIYLCWVNLIWGIINLFPIFPLDGGQATFELLRFKKRTYEAQKISAVISIVAAVALLVGFSVLFHTPGLFTLLLVGSLIADNVQRFRSA